MEDSRQVDYLYGSSGLQGKCSRKHGGSCLRSHRTSKGSHIPSRFKGRGFRIHLFFKKNLFFLNLFYFWPHWVFVAVHGFSLVAASGGYSSLRCADFSSWRLLLLWSTGSRHMGFCSCGTWALERRLSSCGTRA